VCFYASQVFITETDSFGAEPETLLKIITTNGNEHAIVLNLRLRNIVECYIKLLDKITSISVTYLGLHLTLMCMHVCICACTSVVLICEISKLYCLNHTLRFNIFRNNSVQIWANLDNI